MNNDGRKVFLTAEWRNLIVVNFEIEASVLKNYIPRGTELDDWNGKTLLSVVGFQFLRTRLLGIPIPLHQSFEEVNLRFYVRRKAEDGWRRGVVFIKEIVPRRMIAFVARRFYNESYFALPMGHSLDRQNGKLKSAEYHWQFAGQKNSIRVSGLEAACDLEAGSEAAFVTEHYWGYNKQRDDSTLEYRVDHPPWKVCRAAESKLNCDVAGLYGGQFTDSLSQKPSSAFLSEGSAVIVYRGERVSL